MIREAFQFLFKLTLSRNQMLRDITMMRSEIADLKKELVPFTDEEMEILSLRQTNTSKKRGFQKILKGIFSTIFYEPLIAYAIKTYSADQRLILISTSDLEFIYLDKDNKTHVYINDFEVGVLTKNGHLLNAKKQLLARIDGGDELPTHTVYINEKDYGYIVNPRFVNKTSPRAYSLFRNMNRDERNLFLCLTLVNLVEEAYLPKQ
jgi:hypothetical protein